MDAPLGGLGRQGAVRKRKGEVHEMNGHKFVQKQFYQLMLCAFCGDFLLNATGYQCEDCRYTCHKKCYEKVVTKCISKSNTGVRDPCLCRIICSSFNRKMKRKSTTAFPTGLSLSPTSEPTGAATVGTCYHSVARMRASVASVTSLATLHALISSPTSVVCPWRRQTRFYRIGELSRRRSRGSSPGNRIKSRPG